MPKIYIYVVAYDLGFAPNPFDGVCTLACCKYRIRSTAAVGDWIVGMGGGNLKATGRCIYAMRVTDAMTFDGYWASDRFNSKKPARNGSRRTIVGDNIYHRDTCSGEWLQENSLHSLPSGDRDPDNTANDTRVDRVLISDDFIYFGANAPLLPPKLFEDLGYKNRVDHRVFDAARCRELIDAIKGAAGGRWNSILGDPYLFRSNDKRFSLKLRKLI